MIANGNTNANKLLKTRVSDGIRKDSPGTASAVSQAMTPSGARMGWVPLNSERSEEYDVESLQKPRAQTAPALD